MISLQKVINLHLFNNKIKYKKQVNIPFYLIQKSGKGLQNEFH